jgi:monoamine oxidase
VVLIIGAGLSGLLIAYRLKELAVPYRIIEARNRIGGRIFTQTTVGGTPLEMGATWFGSQHPQLLSLIEELNLTTFLQYNGDFYHFYDPGSVHSANYPLPQQVPSYRLAGGTSQLINKLADLLDKDSIFLNQEVKEITVQDDQIKVITAGGQTFQGDKAVLALPPKLWSSNIDFVPSLPAPLHGVGGNTQTWMEDSTKAAVEYAEPYWRRSNRASMIVSNQGPFVECYDHTNESGTKYALCGFLNPAMNYLSVTQRKEMVMNQLYDVFGAESKNYLSYNEYLWANDPFTQKASESPLFGHQNNGHPLFKKSYFNNKIFFSGSETSTHSPGYMEGAVSAAMEAFERIKKSW